MYIICNYELYIYIIICHCYACKLDSPLVLYSLGI